YSQPIAQWHKRGYQPVFAYQLENGSRIHGTPDHQFMTRDGEMRSIDEIFQLGLELMSVHQEWNSSLDLVPVGVYD
ncbi:MAG: hypothetical protein ACKO4R_01490, partial [Synechococcales cyanobacterium]